MNIKGDSFYKNVAPVKLTEGRRVKLHSEGWGLLTEYYLESVKINNWRGGTNSTATLRIGDKTGQVTCVVKGLSVGLLFGLSTTEWAQVEQLCELRQQLFYRYFKNGIIKNVCYEQRLFYNFCMTNQSNDVLVVKFKRNINMRKNYSNEALLEILDMKKCDNVLLDIYVSHLRLHSSETNKR